MTESALDYFATPGPTTDLSAYSRHVDELPSDPSALARVVRGVLLHEGVVAEGGLQFPPERMADRDRIGAAAIVERAFDLDPAPLSVERPIERRMIGYCYHFAVLHCALLRAKQVPARARCGFAAYFRADAWIDHWIVEYWDGDGWILTDPNEAIDVVSRNDFHDAGRAWMLCRAGDEDASRHGNHLLWGWDELRGSLVNDIGALNKVEVGEWSWCDLIAVEPSDQPHATIDPLLDSLARLVSSDGSFQELQRVYESEVRLQPPAALFV